MLQLKIDFYMLAHRFVGVIKGVGKMKSQMHTRCNGSRAVHARRRGRPVWSAFDNCVAMIGACNNKRAACR